MVAELLVPLVLKQVGLQWAMDDTKRPYTLAILPLTVTSGVAPLSDQVIIEALRYGVLANSLDDTQTQKFYFINSWADFTRPLTPVSLQLGYFTVVTQMTADTSTDLYIVEPGQTYAPGAGFTGNMELTTPIFPTMPAAASDPVNAPLEMQQDIVTAVAKLIKSGGQMLEAA